MDLAIYRASTYLRFSNIHDHFYFIEMAWRSVHFFQWQVLMRTYFWCGNLYEICALHEPSKAAVKMFICLSHIRILSLWVFLSSCYLESTSKYTWRIWHDGTNGVRSSNPKFQFLFEDVSAIFSSHDLLLYIWLCSWKAEAVLVQ